MQKSDLTPQEHYEAVQRIKEAVRQPHKGPQIHFGFNALEAARNLADDHDALQDHARNLNTLLADANAYILACQGYVNLQPINQDTPRNGLLLLSGDVGLAVGYYKEGELDKTINPHLWKADPGFWSSCGNYFPRHMSHNEEIAGVYPREWALLAQSPKTPILQRFIK